MNIGRPCLWLGLGVLLALVMGACPALAHRVNVFAYVEGGEVVVECSYSRSERVRYGEMEVFNAATNERYLTGTTDEKGEFRFPVPPAARAAKAGLRVVLKAGEGHQNSTEVTAAEYLAASPSDTAPSAGASPGATPPSAPGGSSQASSPSAPAVSAQDSLPSAPAASAVARPAGQGSSQQPAPAVAPASDQASAPPAAGLQTPGPAASGPARVAATGLSNLPAGPAPLTSDPAALSALVEAAVEKKIAPLRAMLVSEKEKGPGLTEIVGGIGWLVGLGGLAAFFAARGKRNRP